MAFPSIILVRPQMGENIGAAARAMANFGLREMRLVAPRDGWPNPKASDTAGKAIDIIDDAAVFETPAEAVADCQFVLATTSRARAVNMPVMEARAAMLELRERIARGEKCAVLFGAERTGLENEEVAMADAVVTIPVSGEYPSLNLGQAVVVLAYEWLMAHTSPLGEVENLLGFSGECHGAGEPSPEMAKGHFDLSQGRGKFVRNAAMQPPVIIPATREQLHGLFGQLEAALDETDFWRVPEKKDGMWRNIRAVLMRAGMSGHEVATWRGIVRALREGRKA